MAIQVEITGARELIARFDALPDRLRASLRNAVAASQYVLQGAIVAVLSGEVLHVRSGSLRRSITPGPIQEDATSISGPVGTNQIYARIQELGGEIHAKNAANLTIPLDAASYSSGVARFSAREVIDNPSVAGMRSTFFAKGVLFGSDGNSIVPLFALKPSVTLPARPYMSTGLQRAQGEIGNRLSNALAMAMGA